MTGEETFGVSTFWKYRKNYSIGLFTDLNLYYEALVLAKHFGFLNITILDKNLPERVKGLKYIETFKKRTFQDLIRELNRFEYLSKKDNDFYLTNSGLKLIEQYSSSVQDYYDTLLHRMNEEFVIPGWFIKRLWDINPKGQGQVVIPLPLKSWKPRNKKWKDNKWNHELEIVTRDTNIQINKRLPNAFPMDINSWATEVKEEYDSLFIFIPPFILLLIFPKHHNTCLHAFRSA